MAKAKTVRRVPKPKRYSPPGCGSCAAIRPDKKNYTTVENTRRVYERVVRYLRCGFCGHTWKVSETAREQETNKSNPEPNENKGEITRSRTTSEQLNTGGTNENDENVATH